MLTAEYVRGIVDGEGSFTVYVRDPHEIAERKRRVKVEPKFILKLQARDLTILEELKSFSDAEKSIRNQMLGLNIKIVIALKFLIVRNCKR